MHRPTVGARLNNGRIWKEHEAGAKTANLARKHGVSEATNRGRMKVRWQVRYDSGFAALTHSRPEDGGFVEGRTGHAFL